MNSSSDTVSGQAGEQLQRPTSLPAPSSGELPALLSLIQAQADNAYTAYISLCHRDAALAWELKAEYGTFGLAELTAHKAAAEMLGKHRALHEVACMIHELLYPKGK